MSRLEWRYLKEEDYDQMVGWWKWFRFPTPDRMLLPNNGKGGIMIMNGDTNVCAGFLYQTNSGYCLLEYIVSNPEYREKDRKEAVTTLIDTISQIAGELGYKLMFSSISNQNLINRVKEAGFIEGSKTTEFIKKL